MITVRGVYGITPPLTTTGTSDNNTLQEQRLLEKIEQALRGGLAVLQYRNKAPAENGKHRQNQDHIQAHKLRQAQAIQALCRHHHCPFLINDDLHLAQQIKADGLHLGQQDTPLQEARELLGPHAIIGITCHDALPLAQQAERQGADYVAFGSFYPSHTKPNASPACLSTLQQARQTLTLPIVAIGGITPQNAPALIDAGADLIAVVQSLFSAEDPQTRCQQLNRLFHGQRDRN